jgi:hypothetical protein
MDMSDEYNARFDGLSRICRNLQHGVVDGVEIDLRHEHLDPAEWQMFTIGLDEPPHLGRDRPYEPFIWFPWYGVFDEELLRREAEESFRQKEDFLCKFETENQERNSTRPYRAVHPGRNT